MIGRKINVSGQLFQILLTKQYLCSGCETRCFLVFKSYDAQREHIKHVFTFNKF